MDDVTGSLVDQRIKEYDMRLDRIDRLLTEAQTKADRGVQPTEIDAQLARLKRDRDQLAAWLSDTKAKPLENWRVDEIRKAGPMGVWDAVAQQIEKLIGHMEH